MNEAVLILVIIIIEGYVVSIQTLREGRKMPYIKCGMRVQVNTGKFGKITGANHQMILDVRLDGEKHSRCYHPQWRIRYFDENSKLIAEFND